METEAWLSSHGIPYTESTTKYDLFTALSLPHVSRTHLRDMCDCITLILIADDIFDSSDVSDLSKRQLLNNMYLESIQSINSFKPLTPYASAFHNWYQRMIHRLTFKQLLNLKDFFLGINESHTIQPTDKSSRAVPDLEAYIDIRRQSFSLCPDHISSFMEIAFHLDLPDECSTNETLKHLIECIMDAGAWSNVSCIVLQLLSRKTAF